MSFIQLTEQTISLAYLGYFNKKNKDYFQSSIVHW